MILLDTPQQALRAVQFISGMAVSLSSLEFLYLRREFAQNGFFSPCAPSMRDLRVLITVRLLSGLLFASGLVTGYYGTGLLLLLTGSVLLTNRILVFGLEAADQMISIVLFAQLLASMAAKNVPVQKTCLWFIALQASLAYGVAGWSKLLKPAWRNGSYLRALVTTELYGHAGLSRLISRGGTAQFLSLALIGFEAAFPIALLTGSLGCVFFISCMLVMHLTNAFVFGLNLFVWAFLATYPALLYCAWSLHR